MYAATVYMNIWYSTQENLFFVMTVCRKLCTIIHIQQHIRSIHTEYVYIIDHKNRTLFLPAASRYISWTSSLFSSLSTTCVPSATAMSYLSWDFRSKTRRRTANKKLNQRRSTFDSQRVRFENMPWLWEIIHIAQMVSLWAWIGDTRRILQFRKWWINLPVNPND